MTEERGERQVAPTVRAEKKGRVSRRAFIGGAVVGGGLVYGLDHWSRLGEGANLKPRGFSRARPIVTDSGPLPKQVDVAIIGGGFAGICSALSLARRGLSVAVFEKGVVAGEASGRSAGMIECILNGSSHLELIEYSKQRWRGMDALVGGKTGFMQAGNSMLFDDPAAVAVAEGWLNSVNGLPNGQSRMVSRAEAAALAPGAPAGAVVGGIRALTDGSAEPELAVPAIAVGARAFGAKIYQFCAVRGVETSAGRVSGVVTERGTVKARAVVVASGVWSPVLAEQLGLDLPLIQGWVSMASVSPFAGGPPPGSVSLIGPNVGWRRQPDGGYAIWQYAAIGPILPTGISHLRQFWPLLKQNWSLVGLRFSASTFAKWLEYGGSVPLDRPGVFEKNRIYEPELRTRVIDAGIGRLQDTIPAFRRSAVRERWTGAMSMTPDSKPVLSEVSRIPGLVIATGLYHGLTVGPGIGDIVADIVTGRTPGIDIRAFAYERLIDGSVLDLNT